ncbi:MAG: hypothetical protein FWG62_09805, partial [Proteobacteria bacterium]|nr:hypothetical protein [Pseudomonadota bacterium]
ARQYTLITINQQYKCLCAGGYCSDFSRLTSLGIVDAETLHSEKMQAALQAIKYAREAHERADAFDGFAAAFMEGILNTGHDLAKFFPKWQQFVEEQDKGDGRDLDGIGKTQ